jgi:hypothetical protein
MDHKDKQCMYVCEKGEYVGERCTTYTKGGIRMFCSKHHKQMLKWLKKQEIKDNEKYNENVLLRKFFFSL